MLIICPEKCTLGTRRLYRKVQRVTGALTVHFVARLGLLTTSMVIHIFYILSRVKNIDVTQIDRSRHPTLAIKDGMLNERTYIDRTAPEIDMSELSVRARQARSPAGNYGSNGVLTKGVCAYEIKASHIPSPPPLPKDAVGSPPEDSTKTRFARERSEAAGGSPQTSPASRAPPAN